ncbi:MAG: methyl-accepting chemotaxis protein [Chthoniobacteraceae bacterium]
MNATLDTLPPDQRSLAFCHALVRWACLFGVLMSILVFAGWIFDIETLKRVLPGLVAMNPLTAICFVLCSLALWLAQREDSPWTRLAHLLAGLAALAALLKIAGLIFGFDLRLDQILFASALDTNPTVPNRMAPTTAFNFLLLGAALVLADSRSSRWQRLAETLLLVVGLVALLALVGYAYGVRALTGIASYIPMALHTAAVFFVLVVGGLCARANRNRMARLTCASAGGAMLRRIIGAIIGLPLVVGLLVLKGLKNNSYDSSLAFSFFVVAVVIIIFVLMWEDAASIDGKEWALREANDELERRVEARTSDLSNVLSSIGQGIEVLGSSARRILDSTTDMSAGARNTATAVTETTTTVEQLRQTTQATSNTANSVAARAQAAADISQGGRKAIADLRAGTDRIREQMEAIAQCMGGLSECNRAVGEIIAGVEDLAQQSKVLSVNAAIEAAKAGDQGKGFTVVALEVKRLAEQSRAMTSQVRRILGDIQKATNTAVAATEQGNLAVQVGVRQSREASGAIDSLTESVAHAAEAAAGIATSNQQQLEGMDQLVGAMQHIKDAGAQNVATANELSASARKLHELGADLDALAAKCGL